MRSLLACVIGAGFMLCSAISQAVIPVKKSCKNGECRASTSYVVRKSGIACAECKAVVDTRVTVKSYVGTAPEEAGSSGRGGRSSQSLRVFKLKDEQLGRVYRFYIPKKTSGSVDGIVPSWNSSLYVISDYERATEFFFAYWQGENERRFDKRLQMNQIKYPDRNLPVPSFNNAIMAAMVLQDVLEASVVLKDLLTYQSTMEALAHFFLVLEQDRLRSRRTGVVQPLYEAAEWDDKLKALQSELKLNEAHPQDFQQAFSDAYNSTEGASSVDLFPWFDDIAKASDEIAEEHREEKRPGFSADAAGVPSYHSVIVQAAQMAEGEVLALILGNMRWLLRRSGSLYRLYLPGFWSTDFTSTDELKTGLGDLLASMFQAMKMDSFIGEAQDDIQRMSEAIASMNLGGTAMDSLPLPTPPEPENTGARCDSEGKFCLSAPPVARPDRRESMYSWISRGVRISPATVLATVVGGASLWAYLYWDSIPYGLGDITLECRHIGRPPQ